jgi:hypothetical protein
VVVRLPDEQARRELLAIEGAGPWKYGAKAPSRDWLPFPEWMVENTEQLQAWLQRAWQLGQDAPAKPALGSANDPKADRSEVDIEAESSDELLPFHQDEARGVDRRKLVKVPPLEIAPGLREIGLGAFQEPEPRDRFETGTPRQGDITARVAV